MSIYNCIISPPGARFVDAHWATLVQRVQMVMPIADELRSGGMMKWEPYCKIRAANTNQEKMRELYELLHSGGDKVKSAFYSRLEKHESCLFRALGKSTLILAYIPHACDVNFVLLIICVPLQVTLHKLQKLS